ncbi:MAG: hypothetical protein IIA14_06460, partial [SAR324 cluster bacterium]|nr:hypothetical protein [SAR324 cluster bacterium]
MSPIETARERFGKRGDMLAFNLGVFFRNLQGADVTFAAQSEKCQFNFSGGVEKLQEQKDLTHHLS